MRDGLGEESSITVITTAGADDGFYLTTEAVDRLLRPAASESAPGSLFIADVMSPTALDGKVPMPFFGHDDPGRLLTETDWQPATLTWAGNTEANFGRLPDLSAISTNVPRAHLIIGRR